MSGEKEGDYNWAMDQLRDIMAGHTIQESTSIVTDRELALMQCLSTRFPYSYHFLCYWHVNMNVLAETKRFFPGPIRDSNNRRVHSAPLFSGVLKQLEHTIG
jgi:hypothetical protein